MPLSPGTTLGPYEVTAKIGEGGMGEVYRARDTKLDRDVALKVLPPAFTDDPDRLARFEREAKVLASLNHPNIGHIYGLEEAEGQKALVLELVEGPTLAERIAEGPIPVDEALPIATQIVDALEGAHEAGVIHRDLKPANIKVREDGTVKVLDFGLAKALESSVPGDSPSSSVSDPVTQIGIAMGTAAYMSPEQARGKPVDKRTDIWSFGIVLYEMLAGERPFHGGDAMLTLASVMASDVDVRTLPQTVPAVKRVLRLCLAKDPSRRLRDIGDVRLVLAGYFGTDDAPAPGSQPQPSLQFWQRPVPAGALLVLAALVSGLLVWSMVDQPLEGGGVLRVPFRGNVDASYSAHAGHPGLRVDPSGAMLIYRGVADDGSVSLNARRFDQLDGEPIRGTEDGTTPFFSPDGDRIGFVEVVGGSQVLKTVSTVGGVSTTLGTLPGAINGAAWGPDDQLVIGQAAGGLYLMPADGGEAELLTTVDLATGGGSHRWPSVLPGGHAVVFAAADNLPDGFLGASQLAAVNLETGDVVRLGLAGTSPGYVSSGHLVYVSVDAALKAVPFDVDRLEVTGEPVQVADDVATRLSGASEWSVSDDGRLVYATGGVSGASNAFVWVDRAGQVTPFMVDQPVYGYPRLSPDDQLVAYNTAGLDIWIRDVARESDTRLTRTGGNLLPVWNPDGATLTFSSNRSETYNIFSQPIDLSGTASLLIEDPTVLIAGSLSADGQYLLYHRVEDDGQRDVWYADASGTPSPFLQSEFNEYLPSISPDGQWVAYVSDQSGDERVYLQPFPDGGRIVSVSAGHGTEPVWSKDGRELFYRDGIRMMAVEVDPTDGSVGGAQVLFEGNYTLDPLSLGFPNYDVSADGERFLMATSDTGGSASSTEFLLVDNWFEELTRLVPID